MLCPNDGCRASLAHLGMCDIEMLRAAKVRIYPTIEQAEFLEAQFGAVRFAYNKAAERGRDASLISWLQKSRSSQTLKLH
ncbi:helix-turn-helix domain-containing protein [Vibrio metschnikovii]|uniref:helix-turn-helix domain-containing protein n=1 Tax=Vibrio metschnikovii TaxID=28172 RepID=UPI00238197CF|nr:helix-turn-helix domain-containing protein [Vibrio metschnikovii]